jgi:hypothetical protein
MLFDVLDHERAECHRGPPPRHVGSTTEADAGSTMFFTCGGGMFTTGFNVHQTFDEADEK